MISDGQKYWQRTERLQLMVDEVGPGIVLIVDDRRTRIQAQVILVEHVDGAVVAQVPVERCAVLLHAIGDGGHNDVAAIARVARYGELPGWLILRRRERREQQKQNCGGDRTEVGHDSPSGRS